jgi:hypothetical protein
MILIMQRNAHNSYTAMQDWQELLDELGFWRKVGCHTEVLEVYA